MASLAVIIGAFYLGGFWAGVIAIILIILIEGAFD